MIMRSRVRIPPGAGFFSSFNEGSLAPRQGDDSLVGPSVNTSKTIYLISFGLLLLVPEPRSLND